MRRFALAAALMFALALPRAGQAEIITFGGLVGGGGVPVVSYNEDGFTVGNLGSEWYEAHGIGNAVPSIFTDFVNSTNQTIVVTLTGGGLFGFNAVDLAASSVTTRYIINGQLGGVNKFVPEISGGSLGAAFTAVLGDGTILIDTLYITLIGSGDANIDNINVGVIPEPTSLALLGAGLLGLATLRRRARK